MSTIYLNSEDNIEIIENIETKEHSAKINKSFLLNMFKFAFSAASIIDSEHKFEAIYIASQNGDVQSDVVDKLKEISDLLMSVKKFDKLNYYNDILVKREDTFEYTKNLHEFANNISELYDHLYYLNEILKNDLKKITLKLSLKYDKILLISDDDKKCFYKSHEELSNEREKYQIVDLFINELSTLMDNVDDVRTIPKLSFIIDVLNSHNIHTTTTI